MNYKVYITKTAGHDLIEVMNYIEFSLLDSIVKLEQEIGI